MKKLLPILAILLFSCLRVAAAPVPQTGGPAGYSTQCSVEYQTCTTTAGNSVAFGANGQFVFNTLAANATTIGCDNTTFGSDPIVGTVKACYAKDAVIVAPPPPPSAHSVSLSWTAPAGVTGATYNVYRQTCATVQSKKGGSSPGSCAPATNTLVEVQMGTPSTSFVDTVVLPGTSYEYWATTYCGVNAVMPCGSSFSGESTSSNTILATIAPAKPGTVKIQVN